MNDIVALNFLYYNKFKEIKVKTATIYSKTYCPYCVKAKNLLDKLGYKYIEINIEVDEEARAKMLDKSRGRTTVPQIFVDDHHIGGCDDLYALYDKNELSILFYQ